MLCIYSLASVKLRLFAFVLRNAIFHSNIVEEPNIKKDKSKPWKITKTPISFLSFTSLISLS